jgi:hypothetical protein
MKACAFLFLTLATSFLLSSCTSSSDDEGITVSIPKGYAAPTAIPKDSWEDRMKQIMAQGLESEALAAAAAEVERKPTKAIHFKRMTGRRITGRRTRRRKWRR